MKSGFLFTTTATHIALQVAPIAVVLLGVLIPLIEPVGWRTKAAGTILGYSYSGKAVLWIMFSSCLGLVVTLTTYLFIGVTSPLTYNVVVGLLPCQAAQSLTCRGSCL